MENNNNYGDLQEFYLTIFIGIFHVVKSNGFVKCYYFKHLITQAINKKQFLLGLLVVFLFACKQPDEHQSPKNESVIEQTDDEANLSSPLNKDEIVKNIQGKWKESEYPYRMMEISRQEVKFTEEGVVESPTFKAFEISNKCPFEVNNIQEIDKSMIILSIAEEQRCEKLKIENETLILSYSTNTEADYEIVYKKME